MKFKKFVAIFCCFISALCLFSCGDVSVSGYYSFTDDLRNEVILPRAPSRIVSLYGSFSEMVVLAGGELVGATRDVVDENRLDLGENIAIVGDVKHPNIEKVLALDADFIILSADIAGQIALSKTLKATKIPFAYFRVDSFGDYLGMLKILTDITGRSDLYEKNGVAVAAQIEACLESVRWKVPPSALFLRVFSSGAKAKGDDNFVSSMLKDFGAENIATKNPSLLTELSQEIIIKEDPNIIIATSMGQEAAAQAVFDKLLAQKSWQGLSAVKGGRSFMLPKSLFHYKPNAKWGEAYEYLKKILFP